MYNINDYLFKNSTEENMSFDTVYQKIKQFILSDPRGNYILMFGTDSQAHNDKGYTRFATGIMIQRVGKGVWGCIRQTHIPRVLGKKNLHEKISSETSFTEELVSMFTEEMKNELIDIILPHIYQGASFKIEGHIDIGNGKQNKTKEFVREMVGRIESLGIEPVIKPYSICSSKYANVYTK